MEKRIGSNSTKDAKYLINWMLPKLAEDSMADQKTIDKGPTRDNQIVLTLW